MDVGHVTWDNLENMTGLEFSAFLKDQSFASTTVGRLDLTLTAVGRNPPLVDWQQGVNHQLSRHL